LPSGAFAAFLSAAILGGGTVAAAAEPAKQTAEVDLTQWPLRDMASVRDDPFGVLVKYGYTLFTDTANQIGPTVADPARRFAGNNLACGNCHLQAGSQPYAMPLVGVWGQFPQYRAREGAVDRLEDRINGCMERSMNGRALPPDSREMRAFSSYVRWLSTGIPDGAKLVGAGTLQIKEPARAADSSHGAEVFAQTYASCHGADGLGQHAATGAGYSFRPFERPDIFNNGAGMSRLLTAAAYAMHNMPIGTTFSAPVLTEEEAYDVAAYFVGQKRPEMANLDKDFPVRLQKPIDTPYGPYADQFSPEQHKFGLFEPIRAKVCELAAQSRTEKAGEPDNGSAEPERAS
jgi:thiosulfate dehydrogenase